VSWPRRVGERDSPEAGASSFGTAEPRNWSCPVAPGTILLPLGGASSTEGGRSRYLDRVKSAALLILRALVLGPARRHPMRLALPAVGVAVGVAAVAAIHHANASVTESFREAAESLSGRSDFVVTGVAGVPVAALRSLAFLWGHGSFAPAVTGTAVVDDGSGEIAEILGIDPGGDRVVRDMKVVGAQRIEKVLSPDSVFLGQSFARRHRLAPGDKFYIVSGGVRRSVTVAGLLELSGVARAAGGDLLVTDVFTAQRLLGREGFVDRVDIVLDPGESRDAMARLIRARLPAGLTLQPPGASAATAGRMVRAFRFNLNALGSLTLLVGVFLIANAVSISVLRRRPEIATLKALGTSRGTIFAAFLAEGLFVGAAGTALGELGGVFLARAALRSVAGTVGSIYLPTAHIAAAAYSTPALAAGIVGMSAALVATILPAAEAMRVAPAPAMRSGSVESVRRRNLTGQAVAALILLVLAAAAATAPAVDGFPLFGFAAVGLVVAALAFAAPLAVRSATRAASVPLARLFGASGRLAAGFFGGSLARNAVAVAALGMALAMTLAMIVTVSSIRETVRVWVEQTLRSDLFVKAAAGRSRGFIGDLPPEVIPFLRSVPGVAALDPLRVRDATDEQGRPYTVASGDFRVLARLGGLPFLGGRNAEEAASAARARSEVLVSEPYARRFGVESGGTVRLATPRGERTFRVEGVYRDYSNDKGTVMLDRALYLSLFDDPRVTSVAVVAAAGTDAQELRRRILAAAQGRYAVSISTNRELRRAALEIFDRTFAVTRALEAIAIAVAILGIANALVASAVERRRSFGLLRAIGADAGQIRRSVLLEAALTGSVAAVAALAAGAVFAYLLLAVLNPQSFGWTVALDIPAGRLALTVAVVLAAALAAGIFPGRVAASVDPAAALAEE
jgi:putative ABC transport system permease protein